MASEKQRKAVEADEDRPRPADRSACDLLRPERHADHHEHCRVCAEACRRCEEACGELLGAMK